MINMDIMVNEAIDFSSLHDSLFNNINYNGYVMTNFSFAPPITYVRGRKLHLAPPIFGGWCQKINFRPPQ